MSKQEYVLGFVLHGTDILMVRKLHGPEVNLNKWNGIGGSIEAKETNRQAMSRELKEETTLVVPPADWFVNGSFEGRNWKVYCYSIMLKAADRPEIAKENDAGEPLAWRSPSVPGFECDLSYNLIWICPMVMQKVIFRIDETYRVAAG